MADLPTPAFNHLRQFCGRMPIQESIPHVEPPHERNPPRRAVRRPPRDPAATRRDRARARRLRPPRRAQRHPALPGLRRPRLPVRGEPAVQGVAARHRCAGQLAGVHARGKAEAGVPAAPRLLARGAGRAQRVLDRTLRHRRHPRAGGSAQAFAGQRHALRDPRRGAERWASTAPTRRTTPTWSFPSSSTSARSRRPTKSR